MANLASVKILFENEAQAESALAITEGMIKLIFAEMYRLDGDERDEDDWSGAAMFLLRDSDGVFVWSKR